MSRLLQLPLNKICVCLILLLRSNFSYSSDSIYVDFLKVKIDASKYGYCTEYIYNKKLYLFVKESNDSIIKCFVIKNQEIKEFGALYIKNEATGKIAFKEGYWRLKSRKGYEKEYYIAGKKIRDDLW